jgi:hypothetical protein
VISFDRQILNKKIKNLIFLPIEIKIDKNIFNVSGPSYKSFRGLWNTQLIDPTNPEIKTLIDQLAFSSVSLIKYNVQAMDVPPHVDVQPEYVNNQQEYLHIKENEPSGYRIVLSGSTDKLEVFDGTDWRIAHLPACPFAYVLNSTVTKHRIIGESGRRTLYFRGFLNVEKHQSLLEKNLEKYSDYALYESIQ